MGRRPVKKQKILGTIKNIRIERLAWADVMIRLGQLAGVPWIFFTPVAPAFFYFKGGARRARRKILFFI